MPDDRPVRGLRGERVYLRPLEPEDAAIVHRWYEDTRVQTLMGDPPMSLARRRQRYEDAVKGDGADVFRFSSAGSTTTSPSDVRTCSRSIGTTGRSPSGS